MSGGTRALLTLSLAIAWPDTRNTVTVKQLSLKSEKGSDALKEKTG